jgi:hypothetical protein
MKLEELFESSGKFLRLTEYEKRVLLHAYLANKGRSGLDGSFDLTSIYVSNDEKNLKLKSAAEFLVKKRLLKPEQIDSVFTITKSGKKTLSNLSLIDEDGELITQNTKMLLKKL